MDDNNDVPAGISAQEEKELRRVYDELCDFARKAALQAESASFNEKLQLELAHAAEIEVENKSRRSKGTTIVHDDRTIKTLEKEIARVKAELAALDKKPDRKITAQDLTQALIRLGKTPVENEVEDMIWEVDENLDRMVDWNEFRLMFKRNITDRSGLEPSKLYNLVQFMIYDQNENGLVSVDETMNMLYARYGRVKMETKLRELFGEEMRESGKQGGEIDFLTYLAAVDRIQMRTFWNSPQGKLVMSSRTTPPSIAGEGAVKAGKKPKGRGKKGEGEEHV